MPRKALAALSIVASLFALTACGEETKSLGDSLKSQLDKIDLSALKTKAEGASAEVKAQAMTMISQLSTQKDAAVAAVNQLLAAKRVDVAGLLTKAKDAVASAMNQLGDVKKLLGM